MTLPGLDSLLVERARQVYEHARRRYERAATASSQFPGTVSKQELDDLMHEYTLAGIDYQIVRVQSGLPAQEKDT